MKISIDEIVFILLIVFIAKYGIWWIEINVTWMSVSLFMLNLLPLFISMMWLILWTPFHLRVYLHPFMPLVAIMKILRFRLIRVFLRRFTLTFFPLAILTIILMVLSIILVIFRLRSIVIFRPLFILRIIIGLVIVVFVHFVFWRMKIKIYLDPLLHNSYSAYYLNV